MNSPRNPRPALLIVLFANLLFPHGPTAAQVQRAHPALSADACALLTPAEIEAAVGEPLKETKFSAQHTAGMRTAQCVFVMPTFAKSVSLAVTSPASERSSAKSVRVFWNNQFHSQSLAADRNEKEARNTMPLSKEKEEEREKPRPISGLGQEAYWVGSPISGALYVLQGDSFLRISIGGIREEPARIEKSASLARATLARIRK